MLRPILSGIPALFQAFGLAFPLLCMAQGRNDSEWHVPPAYESVTPSAATGLEIKDDNNLQHQIYTRSTAVLIFEGHYRTGDWQSVPEQAKASERLLVPALEGRGYKVLVWRDLKSGDFREVLDDTVANLGYDPTARLFFYYFGHGTVVGTSDDPTGPKGFLVPIDSPSSTKDEQGFYQKAIPIVLLRAYSEQMALKHAGTCQRL